MAAKINNLDYTKIQRVDSTIINPATEDKQDDIIAIQDPLANYKWADVDDDASPNYYGAVDKDGNWFILKETISAGANTYRYVAGTSNYTTNWTNRDSLTYDYFHNIF